MTEIKKQQNCDSTYVSTSDRIIHHTYTHEFPAFANSNIRVEARGHVVGKLGRVPRMIGEFSRMIGGTLKNIAHERQNSRMIGLTLPINGYF